MSEELQEYFNDFRQDIMSKAAASSDFHLVEFLNIISEELCSIGVINGFEHSHYLAPRGMRVDGYLYDDEDDTLDLFVADYDDSPELTPLIETEMRAIFNRLTNFFSVCINKNYYQGLSETSPVCSLARSIKEGAGSIRRVNFYLFSERVLSDRVRSVENTVIEGIEATFHIWDISRLYRQYSSKTHKEVLDINFKEIFGQGLPCIQAHVDTSAYQSYLVVVPANILSDLYEKYGARLLEQNVRTFLQARGNVNKGMRATILNEPEMFFAYNNGITATAENIDVKKTSKGFEITNIKDLQIVNGGQTTASLFHTRRKDKALLEKIFVQMKLSVLQPESSESVVPKISEYANTQNKISAADFFANHPFHMRMEGFSRRFWAPTQGDVQRETKWFYERARGQYADEQSTLTPSEKKRFKIQHPKPQMFTKTDLAKFENVWDEKPTFVNLGAQKNFTQYAKRIGKEWEKNPNSFNEFYYKRVISRAILFRKTEKVVSSQSWYGGYRANIVAYTLALLGDYCSRKDKSIDFIQLWNDQVVSESTEHALAVVAKLVHEDIIFPEHGISNITEWCKKEACWTRLQEKVSEFDSILSSEFKKSLISKGEVLEFKKDAKKQQKTDNGIDIQTKIISIVSSEWKKLLVKGSEKGLFTPKEIDILNLATRIPEKIPTEKQCQVLMYVIAKAEQEGITISSTH